MIHGRRLSSSHFDVAATVAGSRLNFQVIGFGSAIDAALGVRAMARVKKVMIDIGGITTTKKALPEIGGTSTQELMRGVCYGLSRLRWRCLGSVSALRVVHVNRH
jgi:hypothetical protein